MNLPKLFIIGAPKCGTTALYSYLAQHPDVYLPTQKEPHYFSSDFPLHRKVRDWDSYLRLFNSAREGQVCGEASVWYFYSNAALPEITKWIESPVFVFMLRNPYKMAPSLHNQLLYSGRENIADFSAAWRAQTSRKKGLNMPTKALDSSHLFYADVCSLGTRLEDIYNMVGREQVLVYTADDLSLDPGAVVSSVLRALNLSQDVDFVFDRVNEAKAHKNTMFAHILRTTSHVCKPASNLLRHYFPNSPKSFLRPLYDMNSRNQGLCQIDDDVWQEMIDIFELEIRKLEKLTGYDLSDWRAV